MILMMAVVRLIVMEARESERKPSE